MLPFICFDIGGTKTQVAIYKEVENDFELLFSFQKATSKGVEALQDVIKTLY